MGHSSGFKVSWGKRMKKCRTKDNDREIGKRVKYPSIVYAVILVSMVLINILAWNSHSFCDWYIRNILPIWVNTYGRATSVVPFSVGEWMLILGVVLSVAAVLFGILLLGIYISRRRSGLMEQIKKLCSRFCVIYAWIALGVFVVMTLNCFISYHATDFSARYFPAGIKKEYTLEELEIVRDLVVNECNRLAGQMERDADGNVIYQEDMRRVAIASMQAIGEEYTQLSGYYPRPKEFLFSGFLSQQYMQGYFFPFSMEANINGLMCIMNKPSTMCHELAHLKGFLQEDEANLIGFLACINSDDPVFRYSGYLSVLYYLDNDFYEAVNRDKDAYYSHVRISEQVRRDNLFLTDEAWEKVDKHTLLKTETVDKISDEILEATLVMNGVSDGTLSYSRVVGLLLRYYELQDGLSMI